MAERTGFAPAAALAAKPVSPRAALTLDAARSRRARRTPRVGKPQAQPLQLEIAFSKRIDAIFDRLAARASAAARARVRELTTDAAKEDDRTGLARELTGAVDFGVSDAAALVTEVANQNARQMRRALTVLLPERTERLRGARRLRGKAAVREGAKEIALQIPELSPPNVRRLAQRTVRDVRGIGDSLAKRVEALVTRAVSQGIRGEALGRELERELGLERERAQRMAVGQVVRINSDVTRQRHEALGVTEYIWRAVGDGHARAWHWKLNGTRQRYDSPPIGGGAGPKDYGHPGSATGRACRCQALPVIP